LQQFIELGGFKVSDHDLQNGKHLIYINVELLQDVSKGGVGLDLSKQLLSLGN
jgi:hypothetical protein